MSLPRVVGVDAEGREIVASPGRFGPYLKRADGDTRSLATEEQLLTVTLPEAEALFAQPKHAARPSAEAADRGARREPRQRTAGARARRSLRPVRHRRRRERDRAARHRSRPRSRSTRRVGLLRARAEAGRPKKAKKATKKTAKKATKKTAKKATKKAAKKAAKKTARRSAAKTAGRPDASRRRRPRLSRLRLRRTAVSDRRRRSSRRRPITSRSRRRRGGCSVCPASPVCSARKFVSSLGDWTGLVAILAIAGNVSNSGPRSVS